MMFAFKDKLLCCYQDFAIMQSENDIFVLGEGESYAESILMFLKENSEISPEDKIRKSIEIASERVSSVGDKIDIESIDITEYT